MQRLTNSDNPLGLPWLEVSQGDGARQQILLDTFPFVISRNQDTDLPVTSGGVLREHASIEQDGRGYRLRDLGSTNGTFVNGQRVDSALLADGDLAKFGDVEFTFCCNSNDSERATATIVLDATAHDSECSSNDVVAALRRAHETVAQGMVINRYQPIVVVGSQHPYGFEAVMALPAEHEVTSASIFEAEGRLALRRHQLYRLMATEAASEYLPPATKLFVHVDSSEIGCSDLNSSLGRLRALAGADDRLVVQVPFNSACDTACFRQFRQTLTDMGVLVAYVDFAGTPAQILQHARHPPDFLKFSSQMTRRISSGQSGEKTLSDALAAAEEIECQTIATQVTLRADAEALRELHCKFAQGDYYSPAILAADLTRIGQRADAISCAGIAL